ncbi:TIGR02556 family CRISPR-associated protein [Sporohalobacter salinus]|uniref:TIGR02556 family CRISPR-associated protein n=1 Tax=Sporohalobacter salinus TaxID=1494606 RepID=UPI00195F70A2|nr:TIGR02556 family CRISPR-associated protein [Sporohalobacter salinus]MBM7624056.1 CRISPR-associated protein Csh1 [Sporohalobacter salinus]
MIHALKVIGDYVRKNSDESLLSQVVENPNSNGKYNTVLVIVFKKEEEEVVFDEVLVEEFSDQKLDKYAYKYGNPRGGDLTPTSKVTDLEKTFRRIKRPLDKLCKKLDGDTEAEKMILSIDEIINDEEISEEIYGKLEAIEYDDNAVLTIGIRNEENELKYVGGFEEFTQSLMEKYEKKFYYRSSYRKAEKESVGKENLCYICSKEVDKTYGYASTFAFYTLDKKGFTPGGFKRGQAWKNYPVCPECAKILDLGKDYLEENLSARFCGLNYFIVPKTIFGTEGIEKKAFFTILDQLKEYRKVSLKEDTKKGLVSSQNNLFEAMSEFDNYVNFNLMFYEEQNSAFRILLYIQDVLPSYIKNIFEAKKEVDEEEIFRDLNGKDGVFDLDFKFNLISNFFYVDQINKPDFTKQFLEITNSIFKGQKISYELLIDRFIAHLQEKFRNNESTWLDNLKAVMILKFLKKLNLLSETGKEEIEVAGAERAYRERIEDFLDQHSDVLDSNVKRMVFLEGVLAQKLLNIQKQERDGATPFRARLNGLKLNEKIVKRIYSEIINKLEEYDKNYYKQLEEMIADYILESSFEEVSNNELSFYFVTGMNQANKFQFKNNSEGDDE